MIGPGMEKAQHDCDQPERDFQPPEAARLVPGYWGLSVRGLYGFTRVFL